MNALDTENPEQFQLEYLAVLPNGVTFEQGIQNFCQSFLLSPEESESDYASASGDDFSLRAKLMTANSTTSGQTIYFEITTEDAYSLQNAREIIEERASQVAAEVVLLRDSEGERRTCDAYKMLSELENTLRKLVAVRSATLSSERWWSERVLKCFSIKKNGKYIHEERMEEEINDPDITLQRRKDHHDIFYLDLLDLKKAIEDADNWRDGFSGDLKVLRNIERLEMFNRLRRKIAHNRFLSQRNLDDLKQIHGQIMHLCQRVFEM